MRCPNRFFLYLLTSFLLTAPTLYAQNADSSVYAPDSADAAVTAQDGTDQESTEQVRTVTYNKATPTDAQWQRTTDDKDFYYKNEKEFTAEEKPSERDMWLLRFLESIVRFFGSAIGHIVLWLLLAALVGFVLYRILLGDGRIFARSNKRVGEAADEQSSISEDDLLHNNWEEKLRAALDAGNTRMAIRYSYMYLLQLLQSHDLIDYRQDKTNSAYYHELSGHAVRQSFRQLTRDYEYAWYGNFLPSSSAFDAYMQAFYGVKKELGAS